MTKALLQKLADTYFDESCCDAHSYFVRGYRLGVLMTMEVFEGQTEEYRESVLPKAVRKRVVVEAGSNFGWGKYIGLDGAYVTMTGFGASGPANELFKHFGFTVENVVNTVKNL